MTSLITDYVEQMIDELLPRWRDSPRMTQLVAALGEGLQELENVTNQTVVERYLRTAVGAQLDNYADLYGEARRGRGDDDLRAFLFAKIIAIRGKVDASGTPRNATPSAIAEVAALLFFSGQPFGARYMHNQPAAYQLQVTPFEEGPDLHVASNAVSTSAESNGATGWPSTGALIEVSSEDAVDGVYSYKATATTATFSCFLYQFAMIIGRTYRVTLYARRGAQGTNQQISDWFGFSNAPNILIDSDDWKKYTFDVLAIGALGQVKICANGAAGAIGDVVWTDGVEIRELLPKALTADVLREALKILLLATPAGVELSMVTASNPKGSFKFGDGIPFGNSRGFGNAPFSKLLING